jgi:hypothetical protein
MFRARTMDDIARIRRSIEQAGRWSDGLFRVGPVRIGLDGLLAWIPLLPAGAAYSLLAGGFLLIQGYRARAPWGVLARVAVLLGLRTAVTLLGESVLPLMVVELAVDLFRAHRWSADLLVRAIDDGDYIEGPPAANAPLATRRRRVFLGDGGGPTRMRSLTERLRRSVLGRGR